MKNTTRNIMKQLAVIVAIMTFVSASAREKQPGESTGGEHKNYTTQSASKVMSACKGAAASQELWVNNVRTIIFTGGDMWWDLFGSGNAFYGVPGSQDKATMISSNFSGSIWIGGLDVGGQLKVAAMTYRQNGYDFWPGPLVVANATTNEDVCNSYDKIFVMTRQEAEDAALLGVVSDNVKNWPGNGDITKGHDPNLAPFWDVAGDNFYDPAAGDYPYYDIYNKAEKDNLGVCKAKLFGDKTLWWVFNDKGDIHTETGGQSIGLEIRGQAFGFKTNDDINNMTFYSYEVINRSTYTLNKTYFTVWTDADLGCYLDDYVGCDVSRGLGFIYNSTGVDKLSCSGTNAYGDYPPALGCDFFRGPLADYDAGTGLGDGIDNNFNGIIDEVGETIGMSKFLYYNNNIGSFPPQTTNPSLASHYYGYMTGFWKDGSAFTQGGNAYGGTTPVNYVYDGELYPTPTGWNEFSAGNLAGDRRFLQSAGPFTLKPGAVNNVTFGLPWAQTPVKNGNLFSVALLKIADDKAQALFDNCFKILDGPEAPDMTVQEMNNSLLIYLTNKPISNNYLNQYKEADVTILAVPGQTSVCNVVPTPTSTLANPDKFYRFEGYKIYQVINNQVSQTDIEDQTKAKLVFQSDVKNGVSRLINYNYDGTLGADVPKVKVEGADAGLVTTFQVTEDAFATGVNKKLVNNKTYYFIAFAYAYNNYVQYKPDTDPATNACANYFGQKHPYLEGRKIKKAAGIPHNTDTEKDGTVYQSSFGYGPKITRIEGQGNGGNPVDLTDATVTDILNNNFVRNPQYQNGRGPIKVRVVDPLNIPNSTFSVKFLKLPVTNIIAVGSSTYAVYTNTAVVATGAQYYITGTGSNTVANICNTNLQTIQPWATLTGTATSASPYAYGYKYATAAGALKGDSLTWVLTNLATNEKYYPNKSIKIGEEYFFNKIGMSVNIEQVTDPGASFTSTLTNAIQPGAFIEASMTFADPRSHWLTGLKDDDSDTPVNWIRSGPKETLPTADQWDDYATDRNKVFAKVLDGTWAPYCLVAGTNKITGGVGAGPGYSGNFFTGADANSPKDTDPRYISSVDVVITSDQSKWTRCVVFEMQDDSLLAEGKARKFTIRRHQSVDKSGNYAPLASGSQTTDINAANFISETGMGWFPGYAINVETGERLNMAFGEDSYNYTDNGNDMLWNPTAVNFANTYQNAFGGRHYIYVFGHNKDAVYSNTINIASQLAIASLAGKPMGAGRYDYSQQIYTQLKVGFSATSTAVSNAGSVANATRNVLRDAMWVNIPLLRSSEYAFKSQTSIPCDVKVRLRVAKPYRYGYSTTWSNRLPAAANYYGVGPVYIPVPTPASNLPLDTVIGAGKAQNNNLNMYEFSTADIYTMYADASTQKNALDLIRIVPNPYYAHSTYEEKRLESKIRVTNLPSNCTIKIFTMNGTLVRTFKRDVSGQEDITTEANNSFSQSKRAPYLEWDLKNQSGIPVASGLYIFYIDAPGVGEKILKWFGVMRPLDIQSY